MKRTNNPNINTRLYWDSVYADELKRSHYASQGTSVAVNGPYHITPTSRFATALTLIKPQDKVLDIGCGVGQLTKLIKETYKDADVWGVDISLSAIKSNSKERSDITYKQHYIGRKPSFPLNYFDVVFSGETLEHIDTPSDLFTDAYNALKPGGIFILTTPNRDHIKSPEHVWEFDHQDVEDLYLASGFDRVNFIYLDNMEHLMVIMAHGIKQ